MATVVNEKTKLMLKLENGLTPTGQTKYTMRAFANINPEISADDLFSVAAGLANLQTHENNAVIRQDTKEIVEG